MTPEQLIEQMCVEYEEKQQSDNRVAAMLRYMPDVICSPDMELQCMINGGIIGSNVRVDPYLEQETVMTLNQWLGHMYKQVKDYTLQTYIMSLTLGARE